MPAEAAARIVELFRQLGGRGEADRLRPGAWDLAFEGGLLVELDEQLHFNRYRATTLHAEWIRPLPWRNTYIVFCQEREQDCLADGRWGQRWTNPSCERLFGPADPPGTFERGGAPRWKQRALYDALKDMLGVAGSVKLARLAIYDRIEGIELQTVLEGRADLDPIALVNFAQSRVSGA